MKTINTFFAEELSLISLEVRLDNGKSVQVWFNPITGYLSVGRDLITGRFVSVKCYSLDLLQLGFKVMEDEGLYIEAEEEEVVIECPLLAYKKPLQRIVMVEDTIIAEEIKEAPKASNAALELLSRVRVKQQKVTQPDVVEVQNTQEEVCMEQHVQLSEPQYVDIGQDFSTTSKESKPPVDLLKFKQLHWGNFRNWTSKYISAEMWKKENSRFFKQMIVFVKESDIPEVKVFCREVYDFVENFILLRGKDAKITHKCLMSLIHWYATEDLEEFVADIFEGSGTNIKQYPHFLATNLPLEEKVAVGDRRIVNNPNSYICGDNFKVVWDSFKQYGGHMYYRHAGGYIRMA